MTSSQKLMGGIHGQRRQTPQALCHGPPAALTDKPVESASVRHKPVESASVRHKPVESASVRHKPVESASVRVLLLMCGPFAHQLGISGKERWNQEALQTGHIWNPQGQC